MEHRWTSWKKDTEAAPEDCDYIQVQFLSEINGAVVVVGGMSGFVGYSDKYGMSIVGATWGPGSDLVGARWRRSIGQEFEGLDEQAKRDTD